MNLRHSVPTAKVCEAVFHIAVVVLLLRPLIWALPRGIAFAAALVLLLLQSSQPWWLLAVTSLSLLAGCFYLLKTARTWLRPDQDFVN